MSGAIRLIRADVPKVFEPFLKPARYKGAYGGRGGAKSHHKAERIVLRAAANPIRVACIREIQSSIKDSVRQLLVDKIQYLGVGSSFNILDNEIRGTNGSLIVFKGMQSYNAETIKSLEGYDIAWTEEAQTLSHKSLSLLRPTIRKPGSELWFTWNPRHRTDPVDELFRKNPPPDCVSVLTNWRDNPWFPDVLRKEMEYDFATDTDKAEHIWEGAYGVSEGSILGRQIAKAEREGRINDDVDYDPEGPGIEISSDIGFRDTASWWFFQRRARGVALLDYVGDSGLDAEEWIPLLQDRLCDHEWPLEKIWLPHDAKVRTFQSRHSSMEQFLKAFGANRMSIVPKVSKTDRINAARTMVGRCEFHKTRCAEGLDGLRAWEYEFNEEQQVFSREPLHNWASHPSDAYSYGAQVMENFVPSAEPEVVTIGAPRGRITLPGVDIPKETLNDLWEQADRELRNWARREWV